MDNSGQNEKQRKLRRMWGGICLQLSSQEKPRAHLQVSLSRGEVVEMQMYALCQQPLLVQVKSQFLELHPEETIRATPSL